MLLSVVKIVRIALYIIFKSVAGGKYVLFVKYNK